MLRRLLVMAAFTKRYPRSFIHPSRLKKDSLPRGSSIVRFLLTDAIEPPLDSSIPERPCTVILSEHAALYGSKSWNSAFQESFPKHHGMTYRQWSLLPNPTTKASSSPSSSSEEDPTTTIVVSIDGALHQMKSDLIGMSDAILIARGPWMSWMAQFFLESLPLAGLVLVDPMPLNENQGIQQFQLAYQNSSPNLQQSIEYQLFQEFVNHWDHWTLKLERGSVPMMVIQTIPQPVCFEMAKQTAQRHTSEMFGPVPVIPILEQNPEQQVQQVIAVVAEWINERVL